MSLRFPPVERLDPQELELAEGELHVWAVPLAPPQERVQRLEKLLAQDELDRAYRFRFERHRRRFIVGRGVLRELLGAYLSAPPEQLTFHYGDKGKPSLEPRWGGGRLAFNLSHSEELALYGLTLERELGIDVEHLRPMPDAEQIAERFFSISERDTLRRIPPERKSDAFFNCWTRKEAYIKATGDGLSMPLDRFDVTLAPEDEARMISAEGDPAKAAQWTMYHLEPADGYVGALAVPANRWRLVCRSHNP
ncbi:MAG: 4'-phosphopantetheinyl transferase superfamily protein [Acidobacteriota bacterium]|nr:4'-phosphopantetheinyl transferase superfamily protein [Acidobacteriota bacterium]